MVELKSEIIYEDLKNFFDSQHELIKKVLLSRHWNENEQKMIEQTTLGYFSKDFLLALKLGKSMFLETDLIDALKIWFTELKKIYEKKKCLIISASKLDQPDREFLEKKLEIEYKNLSFLYVVDPSIIAGILVRIENLYIDSSFRSILKELKKGLLK